MLQPRVLLGPASWDRGDVLLLQLALPFMVEVDAQGLANGGQAVAAACRRWQQVSEGMTWQQQSHIVFRQLLVEPSRTLIIAWQTDESQTI